MKWQNNLLLIIIINFILMPAFASGVRNKCLADFKSHIINTDTAWFDDCELNDSDIPLIFSYLQTHKEITQLYLLNNKIGDKGAILLSKNKTLKLLELRNNFIGKQGALALTHSSIHLIDIQGNKYSSMRLVAMTHKSFRNKIQGPDDVIILG